jgi:hypothetical protein
MKDAIRLRETSFSPLIINIYVRRAGPGVKTVATTDIGRDAVEKKYRVIHLEFAEIVSMIGSQLTSCGGRAYGGLIMFPQARDTCPAFSSNQHYCITKTSRALFLHEDGHADPRALIGPDVLRARWPEKAASGQLVRPRSFSTSKPWYRTVKVHVVLCVS